MGLLYASAGCDSRAEAEDMRIDLATEPDFQLGPMRVSPATREVFAPAGREVLEPRVMMVLVVLGHSRGQVISRDALIDRCWDGLAVGDDAINRVIGKLRKLATATESFEIETITKVGYRLSAETVDAPATASARLSGPSFPAAPDAGAPVQLPEPSRGRPLLPAAIALAVAAALIGWIVWRADPAASPPRQIASTSPVASDPATEELIRQGSAAIREHSPQRIEQGVAQLREATVRDPKSAHAWGYLATAYVGLLNRLPFPEQAMVETRAKAAIDQALTLDPQQPQGLMAKANIVPLFGNWEQREALEQIAIAATADGMPMRGLHARFEVSVGRVSESLPEMELALKKFPTGLYPKVTLAQALWAVGRIDEADRLADEALRLYPRNYLPWFHKAYLLMYSGRAEEAVRFAANRDFWPDDVPQAELALVQRMATALASGDPARGDAIIAEYDRLAPLGRGYMENAIRIAAALDRPDDAFRHAETLYLSPQGKLPDTRFQNQRNFGRPGDRLTELLFLPPVDKLHGDPRFIQLLTRMGLAGYWRKSGSGPDFCRDQAAACGKAGIPLPKVSAP